MLRTRIAAALVAALAIAAAAQPAAGYENGLYPRSALASIASGQNVPAYLYKGDHVSAAWNTANLCAAADGVPLLPSLSVYDPAATAYRSFRVQVILRAQLGHNAAPIVNGHGTSNHGTGRAVDLRTLAMRRWIDAHGRPFGLQKAWSDASWEWWHIVNHPELAGFHRPDPGASLRFPTVRKGSGGRCQAPTVREVQRRLGLPQDGDFGSKTAQAVRRFQRARGLKPDGVVGSKTMLALRKRSRGLSKKTNARVVGKVKGQAAPMAGQDVRAVQGLLNASFKRAGRPRRVKVTGVADGPTVYAIKVFQRLRGLPATGTVDDRTYAALLKASRPPQEPQLQLTAEGVRLVASFEGYRSCPYLDTLASPHVWTQGFGHTSAAGPPLVGPGSPCWSRARAEAVMRGDLDKFGKGVVAKLKAPTSNGQYSAQVSLAFNVGIYGWGSSTLLRLHNQRDYAGAAGQFKRWNRAGGRPVLGLTRRRAAECGLYVRGSSAAVQRARPC
jgi:lysozyme